MASPQTENGYTRISNELIDAMCRTELRPPAAGQVLLLIIRQTYGWQKKENNIPIAQIMQQTGLSRRTVIYALQELEAKNIIRITRHRDDRNFNSINSIGINKDHETWEPEKCSSQMEEKRKNDREKLSTKRGSARHGGSARHRPKVVHDILNVVHPYKESKRNKERSQLWKTPGEKGKRPYLEGDPAFQDPITKQWRVKIHTGEWVDYVGNTKPEWR